MKQVLQNLKTGEVTLEELPVPHVKKNHILIKSTHSLVSIGTEKMLLKFGKAGWINKARQQPEKVKQVLNKIQTDGFSTTVNTVMNKLDQPMTLGYSNVGVVVAVGNGVTGFKCGDRVVSNGPHAEIVQVPENLCAKIPDTVSDEEASFTVISSIALQGIRLIEPTIGETFVVMGLGLIGLVTVQLLKANGCRVVGFDFDANKVELANNFGANAYVLGPEVDPVKIVNSCTNFLGADGVLITASTKSNDPVSQSAQMCRKRGRVVLVGVVGLNLNRSDFYEKEISFQVSCSYGPGRYETNYESKNYDYPIGYVRWTENRNFQTVLHLMSEQKLFTEPLLTKRVRLDNVPELYEELDRNCEDLGILIQYDEEINLEQRIVSLNSIPKLAQEKDVVVGVFGAGNFTGGTILPELVRNNIRLKYIVSGSGVTAKHKAKKFGFENVASSVDDVFNDPEVNTVIISTPHSSHGNLALKALKARKHVFVEKPLGLKLSEIEAIEKIKREESKDRALMVGYNRRFSPLIKKMKELIQGENNLSMIMTVNAGHIDATHWVQDDEIGGGRLIGEACHFVDLLNFIADSTIVDSNVIFADNESRDSFVISLKFKNGSIGVVNYFSNGHKSYPKERLEVYVNGKNLVLDNFKSLKGYGFKNFSKLKLKNQDKGHRDEFKQFIDTLKSGAKELIPSSDIFRVSKLMIELNGNEK